MGQRLTKALFCNRNVFERLNRLVGFLERGANLTSQRQNFLTEQRAGMRHHCV